MQPSLKMDCPAPVTKQPCLLDPLGILLLLRYGLHVALPIIPTHVLLQTMSGEEK